MTSVEFHTGVPDPLDFACRLLRKAHRQGLRVGVTAPPPTLAALDQALWSFDATSFVPHVLLADSAMAADSADGAARLARTPLWLMALWPPAWPPAWPPGWQACAAPTVLVNLGSPEPVRAPGPQRIIDIVGREPDEAAAGRQRWRAYAAPGFHRTHHASDGPRG